MDKASVSRYVILFVAVVNAVLNLVGFHTISDELTSDLVAVVSGVVMLWVAWKNNYLSKKGRAQKDVLDKHGLK